MSGRVPWAGVTARALGRVVLAGATAAVATRAVRAALGAVTDPAGPRWTRTNHRGEPVSLLEGPAVAGGLLAGIVAAGTCGPGGPGGSGRGRTTLAAGVAVAGGTVLGLVDDLSEDQDRRRKGLRGHLGALARGELTTGGLKVVGIGLTSLAAAALAVPPEGPGTGSARRDGSGLVRALDVVTSGALIAASANLVNLFDLRPGRALKVGLLGAPVTLVAGLARARGAADVGQHAGSRSSAAPGIATYVGAACVSAAAAGAAGAALGPDLAERDMLGDGGANALGAALGAAAAFGCPRPVRLALLAGAVGLTLASERVSFTRVIERTPVLRGIDAWGRRPVPPEDPPR